jgi:hypothetical protein
MGLLQILFGCINNLKKQAKPEIDQAVSIGVETVDVILDKTLESVADNVVKPLATKIAGQNAGDAIDNAVKTIAEPAIHHAIEAQATIVKQSI